MFRRSGDGDFGHFAEVEAFECRPDLVAIADDHRQEALRREVVLGDARDVVLVDGQDPGHEGGEVVVGEAVEGELDGSAAELFGGFEVARIAAGQRGTAELQLGGGDRPAAADGLYLGERLPGPPRP